MINTYRNEYQRYKVMGEKAIGQTSDEALNRVIGPDNNSIAVIIRHIGGNLLSRFTDFLNADGEKPWRDRENEFLHNDYSRAEIEDRWQKGWDVLFQAMDELSDADLSREVKIRGVALTVDEALARSLSHVAYHVGQIVTLARILASEPWDWITIPRGKSGQYNQNPVFEKKIG